MVVISKVYFEVMKIETWYVLEIKRYTKTMEINYIL